jgi:hypothetical protein
MDGQSVVTIVSDAVVLAAAVLGYLSTRRKVGEVHSLVNNQLDRQLTYNGKLAAALTAAGEPVPEQDKSPGA